MEIITVIVSGILGAIGGFVAGSGKPLVDWHIEQKRDTRKKREAMVQGWRMAIQRELNGGKELIESTEYMSLRPYLSSGEIKELEFAKTSTTIIASATGLSGNQELSLINSVVDRLVKKWKLI